MMSKAEVRAIVDENIRDLRNALQLNEWTVDIDYDANIDGRATCAADPMRFTARIVLNPGQLKNEKDVLDTLLHELLHIYHCEFDLYREAVRASVGDRVFKAMAPAFETGCERVVQRLCFLFRHTFNTTPKKLIAKVRREAAN